MSMLPDVAPPIVFAAANCKLEGKCPNGIEEYWSADIKAVRYNTFCKVFTQVLFVETPGEICFLAGIEAPDGIDRHINPELARKQAEFIQFLRDENDRDIQAIGVLSEIFLGHEYATAGKATAAYLAARGQTHAFGVGFLDADGEYQLIRIEPGEDPGFDGTRFLPFDELGK